MAEIAFYNDLKRYVASESQLKSNGYPRENPSDPSTVVIQEMVYYNPQHRAGRKPGANERECERCKTIFAVGADGKGLPGDVCRYHGRRGMKFRGQMRYGCCSGSVPCMKYKTHVAYSEDLTGYVKTKPRDDERVNKAVYSIDTEMIWTSKTREVAQIAVIDMNLEPVYESYVKPDAEIIDYNTTYSGIRESDLEGVETSLSDVQAKLLELFTDQTILIGHGLENDLKALKLIHSTVVDTALVFPHTKGPPFKRGLRNISMEQLGTAIHTGADHGSNEDAIAVMRLMLKKTGRRYEIRPPKRPRSPTDSD